MLGVYTWGWMEEHGIAASMILVQRCPACLVSAGVLGVEMSVVFGLVSKGYGVCSFWVHRWYLVVRSCGRLRTLVWTRASRS